MSCMIDAMYNCNVNTTDILDASLHTNIEGMVRIRLYGILEKRILNIYPEKYRKKFIIEWGKKVVYAVLKRSLYKKLIRYLLFWS